MYDANICPCRGGIHVAENNVVLVTHPNAFSFQLSTKLHHGFVALCNLYSRLSLLRGEMVSYFWLFIF